MIALYDFDPTPFIILHPESGIGTRVQCSSLIKYEYIMIVYYFRIFIIYKYLLLSSFKQENSNTMFSTQIFSVNSLNLPKIVL